MKGKKPRNSKQVKKKLSTRREILEKKKGNVKRRRRKRKRRRKDNRKRTGELTFVAIVGMELQGIGQEVLLALQNGQQALMDANILLLRLHHKNAL